MDEPLKQFDIAPAGELHDRMRHALPEGHRIEWHAIGGFNVGTSGIAIGDPYELPEHESLPFPEGFAQLEALVFVDEGDQIPCVAGFKITAEDAKPNSIRESEDLNFSIDSANAYVACAASLETQWRLHEDEMSWNDVAELHDEFQCSLDELTEKSELTTFAMLAGDQQSPFLYCFPSGWGDGIYWLDELCETDVVVGYFCRFLEDAE